MCREILQVVNMLGNYFQDAEIIGRDLIFDDLGQGCSERQLAKHFLDTNLPETGDTDEHLIIHIRN